MLLLVFCAFLCPLTFAQREEVSFSRAWRFHYGPGGDDATYGPGNNWQSAFSPITGCTADPLLTYPDPHRMTSSDCSTACAYDPVCMAWVHDASAQTRTCMHASAGAVCQPSSSNATTNGGQRATATPLQTNYSFAAASLPEAASWPLVDAPHDALMALNGTFCEACGDARHAYRQRTVAWYRKTFALPSEWAGVGATQVRFEGIMHFAQLWLNGVYLGAHSATYGEFIVRLDNVSGVVFGGVNTLSLRADASYGSEHWYGGGGLFREVQLVHTGPQAWVEQGVWVPPELPLGATSTTGLGEWVNFGGGAAATATFHLALYDNRGVCVANATSAPSLAQPGGTAVAHVTLPLPGDLPRWSGSTPVLYTAVATLLVSSGSSAAEVVVDSRNFTTGFRATHWDADKGFLLNGEVLRQRGFSHHNSFAGVGVAIPPRLDLFRAQVSQALGANIWRMSHNPYRTSLYDILDALGTLVWDESRDMGPAYQPQQMHDMVKRGRIHPSTIINSCCNEIECGSVKDVATGVNIVGAAMVNASKALDPTRPTTANSNSVDGLESVIDVQGFSHASAATFTAAHAAHPLQPLVLSECCSCSTQRSPRSYNYECMVKQNAPGDLPFVAGSLGVWTLFDCECTTTISPPHHLSPHPNNKCTPNTTQHHPTHTRGADYGEPPDLWPYVSSSFGQLDLAGFPKGHAYWYTANWGNLGGAGGGAGTPPTVRVLDVLDAPLGAQGGITATTSAASAELFADGVSLGTQAALGAQLFWKLPGAVSVEGGNCSWPQNQTGTQCKGLQAYPSATTAVECKALACSKGLLAWQWGSGAVSSTGGGNGAAAAAAPGACWAGTPTTDPTTPCPPPTNPTAQWRGESRKGITLPSNATLLARDGSGVVVGRHTVLAPTGPPAALTLTLDAPSPSTGTGERLVLDGHDCALVRVSVVDKAGVLISATPANITWSVVSGPGRLGGVGAGDPASHEQPGGTTVATFGGLARAVFITTVDCVSGGRDRVRAVDVEGEGGPTNVLPQDAPCPGEDIVVAADAPGLPRALLHIPVSGDGAVDGVLAVARASAGGGGAVRYLGDFVG